MFISVYNLLFFPCANCRKHKENASCYFGNYLTFSLTILRGWCQNDLYYGLRYTYRDMLAVLMCSIETTASGKVGFILPGIGTGRSRLPSRHVIGVELT